MAAEKEQRIIKERYQLLGVIGRGGWGVVYKGLDLTTAQVVAVKQVPLAGVAGDALRSIMMEITLLQRLQHPNIVRYIDSVHTERDLLIVLEFVENGSLADITKQVGRFPEPLCVIYISQVLAGLAYLHDQGVIHRDIKAANILATKDGNVKVADFGVATAGGDKQNVMGSPYWMAPEVIELNGASPKSDIWSVGCTLVELLTGKPPYYDLDQMPALFRIVQDDCPPLPAGISPLCREFLMLCFQKEPLLRQSAPQLLKHRWIAAQGRAPPTSPTSASTTSASASTSSSSASLNPNATSSSSSNLNASNALNGAGALGIAAGAGAGVGVAASTPAMLVTPSAPSPSSTEQVRTYNLLRTKTVLELRESQKDEAHANKKKKEKEKEKEREREKEKEKEKAAKRLREKEREKERDKERDSLNPKKSKGLLTFSMRRKGHSRKKSSSKHTGDAKSSSKGDLKEGKEAAKEAKSASHHHHRTQSAQGTSATGGSNDSLAKRSSAEQLAIPKPLVTTTSAHSKPRSDDESDSGSDWDVEQEPSMSSSATTSSPIAIAAKGVAPLRSASDSDSDWDTDLQPDDSLAKAATSPGASSPLPSLGSLAPLSSYREDVEESDSWENSDDDLPGASQSSTSSLLSTGSASQLLGSTGRQVNLLRYQDSERDDAWASDDSDEEDLELPVGDLAARLKSRLTGASVTSAEEDPFDDLFDQGVESDGSSEDEFDLEGNFIKDHLQEISTQMSRELSTLVRTSNASKLQEQLDACKRLVDLLREYPQQRGEFLKNEGVIPMLELLELSKDPSLLDSSFQVILAIMEGQPSVQESLLLLGVLPVVVSFWGPMLPSDNFYPSSIRSSATKAVNSLIETLGEQTIVRQFITSRSLASVEGLLRPAISNPRSEADRDSFRFGVNLIHKVLNASLGLKIKKNDLCRIWARAGVFQPLARSLVALSFSGSAMDDCLEIVVESILLFSRSDEVVKSILAAEDVLKSLIAAASILTSKLQLGLVKALQFLSMDSRFLSNFQSCGAIEAFVKLLLSRLNTSEPLTQYLLMTLFNLCRLSPTRQALAVTAGIIPCLQQVIRQNSTTKQFALPIYCELARSSAVLQPLWKSNGLNFYVQLFNQGYPWQVQALEAIASWLQMEPDQVSRVLAEKDNVVAIASLFRDEKDAAFVNLLEPLLKIIQASPMVARAVVKQGFLASLRDRLSHPNALVRVNMLKLLKAIFEAHPGADGIALIESHKLLEVVKPLESDRAVLVNEMAARLRSAFSARTHV